MIPYVKMVLDLIPDDMKDIAATPAAKYLYQINEQPVALNVETAEMFHSMTVQLYYYLAISVPGCRRQIWKLAHRNADPCTAHQ
jgi:hypothetical protein